MLQFTSFSVVFFAIVLSQTYFCQGRYVLVDEYKGNNFFNNFYFEDLGQNDPTHGTVNYVNEARARELGLIDVRSNGQVYMGVDMKNVVNNGRPSVRLRSKKTYTQALMVIQLTHMPGGQCGSWPAFWTVGLNNWPHTGEIDIIEQVNFATKNSMTVHTSERDLSKGRQGCFQKRKIPATGNYGKEDCQWYEGCGMSEKQENSFGTPFNQNGGGVFAMMRTNTSIQMWFFPAQSQYIANAIGANPDPYSWGLPTFALAIGDSDCVASNFAPHSMIFDITFCGDWAGAVMPTCPNGQKCSDFVNKNPTAFSETYWLIDTLNTYVDVPGAPLTPSTTAAPKPSTTATPKPSTTAVPVVDVPYPDDPTEPEEPVDTPEDQMTTGVRPITPISDDSVQNAENGSSSSSSSAFGNGTNIVIAVSVVGAVLVVFIVIGTIFIVRRMRPAGENGSWY